MSGDFHFSSKLLSIPGVAGRGSGDLKNVADRPEALTCNAEGKWSKGRVPPALVYHSDPEFSERARKEKKQGVVVLALVINEDGLPENVRVTKPIGYGLDEEAIRCVQRWKFKPAEKDGQPVPVGIAVEVDFHLY